MTVHDLNERYAGREVVLDLNYYDCDCDYRLYWRGRYLEDPEFAGGAGVLTLGIFYAEKNATPFYEFEVDRENRIISIRGKAYLEGEKRTTDEIDDIFDRVAYESGDEFFDVITSLD